MSRIGKLPIAIPEGVEISVSDTNRVTVKGKLGELEQLVDPDIKIKQEDGSLSLKEPTESKDINQCMDFTDRLINNMVQGVSEGFTISSGIGWCWL